MQYIIKSEFGYYQGTICKESYFTNNVKDALKFKDEKTAKKTIKFHSINGTIERLNPNT